MLKADASPRQVGDDADLSSAGRDAASSACGVLAMLTIYPAKIKKGAPILDQ